VTYQYRERPIEWWEERTNIGDEDDDGSPYLDEEVVDLGRYRDSWARSRFPEADAAKENGDAAELHGDSDAAVAFLEMWEPGDPWQLHAIDPDPPIDPTTGKPRTLIETREYSHPRRHASGSSAGRASVILFYGQS
jgi:hypothetical protein